MIMHGIDQDVHMHGAIGAIGACRYKAGLEEQLDAEQAKYAHL